MKKAPHYHAPVRRSWLSGILATSARITEPQPRRIPPGAFPRVPLIGKGRGKPLPRLEGTLLPGLSRA